MGKRNVLGTGHLIQGGGGYEIVVGGGGACEVLPQRKGEGGLPY